MELALTSIPIFDTHKTVKELMSAGIQAEQAEAFVRV